MFFQVCLLVWLRTLDFVDGCEMSIYIYIHIRSYTYIYIYTYIYSYMYLSVLACLVALRSLMA